MKKYLALSILVLFVGCARNNPEFVPISLNWFEFQAIENSDNPSVMDFTQEELCLVSMTRALMENETIRENSKSGKEYDVQYFGTRKSGDLVAEFRGRCKDPTDLQDLERQALTFSNVRDCNFTARCDAKGKVTNLSVF